VDSEAGSYGDLGVQDLLNAFPFFAMVINEEHEVIMANTLFAREAKTANGVCPINCFEVMHGTDSPHPDCPLNVSLRTHKAAEQVVNNLDGSSFAVSVYPIALDPGRQRLFLHLARSI